MKIEELVAKAREPLDARTVYAQPYEKDGITVIAAATVAGGAGGGNGHDKKGQDGEGGGFGVQARPSGAYVIKDGKVRWMPAVDVNRLFATAGAVAVSALFVAARLAKLKKGSAKTSPCTFSERKHHGT